MSDPSNPPPQATAVSFKLEDLPRPSADMPDSVRQQVQSLREGDARLGPAMLSVEPEKKSRIDTTVFESGDKSGQFVNVSAVGKVAGLNVKGRF